MKLKVKTQDEMIRAEAKLLRRMVRRSRRTRLRSSIAEFRSGKAVIRVQLPA